MIKKPITVQLANGLEARPVALLVQVASQYESKIYVETENKKVNAKSIMGMMTLGLNAGESVVVSAEGTDEQAAIENIEKYLSSQNQGSQQPFCYHIGQLRKAGEKSLWKHTQDLRKSMTCLWIIFPMKNGEPM